VSALMGLVTLSSDLETGMLVASKVGNLHSKFGHAMPSGYPVIRYVHDGWTKPTLNVQFPTGGRGITINDNYYAMGGWVGMPWLATLVYTGFHV